MVVDLIIIISKRKSVGVMKNDGDNISFFSSFTARHAHARAHLRTRFSILYLRYRHRHYKHLLHTATATAWTRFTSHTTRYTYHTPPHLPLPLLYRFHTPHLRIPYGLFSTWDHAPVRWRMPYWLPTGDRNVSVLQHAAHSLQTTLRARAARAAARATRRVRRRATRATFTCVLPGRRVRHPHFWMGAWRIHILPSPPHSWFHLHRARTLADGVLCAYHNKDAFHRKRFIARFSPRAA